MEPRTTSAAPRVKLRVARAGGDPTLEVARKKGPTFRRVYETVTEIRRKNWQTKTTEASWCRGFDKHVLPLLGDKPVAAGYALHDLFHHVPDREGIDI